ncbi:hypothetical protein RJ640_022756 [Escallonia rubra]|uniref:Retrovirus-related Pol polyprotein from transposon RE2 n=1 Tax=Escallonia rubra TaxID=112253 RepID=A0AA88UTH7_9ASTE|nr:hypothetical protein RJ640_022756 [Escallonia rubra]
MAKDAETSKPKHLYPTLEYYLSSQANSDPPIRATVSRLNEANNSPSLGQAQAAATSALLGLTPDGASHHMTGNLNFFSSIWDIPPSPVGLPDGLQTNAIKAGNVSLADGITLRHVLYVPNLAVNLIFVSCLATDANCFVAFSHDICVLQDRTSKSPIGLGKMHQGVFVFQPLSTATVAAVSESESESYELWHRRMGHPSSQPLIHLHTVSVISPSLKTICDVCCRAKHTRTVFPDSTSRAMDIFGLIHCDIWGPYRSDNGHEFDSQPMTQFYNDHEGDPPPSPAATHSPSLSGITAGPDPEISSPASPSTSPTASSPTLGRGKRQKKAPSVLKDYSHADHTLFTYRKGDVFLYVLVYVDDLILAGNNSTAYASFKQYLNDCFKLKDLGSLKYFLGIEAARGPRGLFLSKRKYALVILSESGLSASKPAAFPMEQNHGLALARGPFFSDPGPYRRLIGRLIYLTITRPDICYAVHVLSQFMQSPRSQHWDAALRVLRYLKAASGQGLFFTADSPLQIYAFCDSNWASCPLTRRSVTRYFVSLGNSPISWSTKKQPTVSQSSAEAEYRSMAVTTCELTWLKSFLLSLGVHHARPMRLFCDNQAALHIASNPVFHERTKHIEIDCHYVREQLLAGNINTAHVRTAQQFADIFTKALGRHQFHYLCGKLGIRNLHAPT